MGMHSGPALAPVYVPVAALVIYWLVLIALHYFMRDRKPYSLKYALFIHNINLMIISIILTAGVAYELVRTVMVHGIFGAYCGSEDAYDSRLYYWSNWFYLSKYYELFDTVFLVLRKKELTVLHVWHHSAVLLVCWFALQQEILMGWITVFNNAFVHIAMYYYYAIQCLNISVWWKKYLTSIQMVQFIADCGTSLPWLYYYTQGVPCKGTLYSWLFANFVGISFFFLFLDYYRVTYNRAREAKKGSTGSTKKVQ